MNVSKIEKNHVAERVDVKPHQKAGIPDVMRKVIGRSQSPPMHGNKGK